MERLNVNPTRMMLTTLKKKLATATRGHKLMKDKRDELMKGFLELARENKELRGRVEAALAEVYESFSVASAVMSHEVLEEALMFPKQGVELAGTSGELDSAIRSMAEVFPIMLELAAKEKEAAMLAAELERTRRRVNALEYVKIPQLQMTIRYIVMKLDENERGNQTRLMKVKDMILAEAIEEKRAADEREYEEACN